MANGGTGGGAGTGGAPGAGPVGEGTAGQSAQVADALSEWAPTPGKGEGAEPGKGGEKVGEKPPEPKVDEKAGEGEGEGEGVGEPGKPAGAAAESPEMVALKAQVGVLQNALNAILQGRAQPAEPGKTAEEITPYLASQEEIDKALGKPEDLNALLSKVEGRAVEKALKMIPAIIDHTVRTQLTLRTKVADFYGANKDLLPHREFVGHVVDDMMGKNPDWRLDKVFGELPKEVRKRLGLKQQADAGGKRSPASPHRGGGARQPAEHSTEGGDLQAEIADLVDLEGVK